MRSAIMFLALAGCALLVACDQNPKSDHVTINGQNGNVTISANGHQFSIKADGDKNGNFSMSGDNGHFTMHASDGKQTVEINSTGGSSNLHVPDFVTDYPGAKVQSTAIDTNATGATGTFAFQTTDSPAAVIAYYKQKSAGAGLSQMMDANTGGAYMFGANADGGKKALEVMASAADGSTHVQVTWTRK